MSPDPNPLTCVLIAYAQGEPIVLVDARCKDAAPLKLCSQENMLHLDNTPFNREIKVLISWETGKLSGPSGQNLVFLPGTQFHARGRGISYSDSRIWTENCSTFSTVDDMEFLFQLQRAALNLDRPLIVEVACTHRPLTTIFAASDMVHHRYRTEGGGHRSSITISFQGAAATPQTFIDNSNDVASSPLTAAILGYPKFSGQIGFLAAIEQAANIIGEQILSLLSPEADTPTQVPLNALAMSEDMAKVWLENVTAGHTVVTVKRAKQKFPYGDQISAVRAVTEISEQFIQYDKHGPLDLRFHGTFNDEVRKAARIHLRELRAAEITERLRKWQWALCQPRASDIMEPDRLAQYGRALVRMAENSECGISKLTSKSAPYEWRSLRQFIEDLSEAVLRCGSLQTFLTTSLFLFLCCDDLVETFAQSNALLFAIGRRLLRHYVSVLLLQKKAADAAQTAAVDQL